jgi:hypothetical protein
MIFYHWFQIKRRMKVNVIHDFAEEVQVQALLAKIIPGKYKKCGLMDTVISIYELNELTALGELLHRRCVFVHEAIGCDDAAKLWGGE